AHGLSALTQVIQDSDLEQAEPLTALNRLIRGHLTHRELLMFLMFQYRPDSLDPDTEGVRWIPYVDSLDSFFLRGQHTGLVRIDIGAPGLTELFVSLVYGMVDAERRGRAASAGSAAALERFFLRGAGAEDGGTSQVRATPHGAGSVDMAAVNHNAVTQYRTSGLYTCA